MESHCQRNSNSYMISDLIMPAYRFNRKFRIILPQSESLIPFVNCCTFFTNRSRSTGFSGADFYCSHTNQSNHVLLEIMPRFTNRMLWVWGVAHKSVSLIPNPTCRPPILPTGNKVLPKAPASSQYFQTGNELSFNQKKLINEHKIFFPS